METDVHSSLAYLPVFYMHSLSILKPLVRKCVSSVLDTPVRIMIISSFWMPADMHVGNAQQKGNIASHIFSPQLNCELSTFHKPHNLPKYFSTPILSDTCSRFAFSSAIVKYSPGSFS